MSILQAGMYPKQYVLGLKGTAKIPCAVCGSWQLHRLRVVTEGVHGQSVTHVCVRNLCLRSVFLRAIDPVKAIKIRSNGIKTVICSGCNRDARGGVAILGPETQVVDRLRENLCEICLFERIENARMTNQRIKLEGGMD